MSRHWQSLTTHTLQRGSKSALHEVTGKFRSLEQQLAKQKAETEKLRERNTVLALQPAPHTNMKFCAAGSLSGSPLSASPLRSRPRRSQLALAADGGVAAVSTVAAATALALRAQLAALFLGIDKDGDGAVTRRELLLALRRDPGLADRLELPQHVRQEGSTRAMFERVFADIDADGSDTVTLAEFTAYFERHPDACERAAKEWAREHPQRVAAWVGIAGLTPLDAAAPPSPGAGMPAMLRQETAVSHARSTSFAAQQEEEAAKAKRLAARILAAWRSSRRRTSGASARPRRGAGAGARQAGAGGEETRTRR